VNEQRVNTGMAINSQSCELINDLFLDHRLTCRPTTRLLELALVDQHLIFGLREPSMAFDSIKGDQTFRIFAYYLLEQAHEL
jgi:hypothetical protein